ncbi:MAG: hypothetical protein ACXABG_02150 [Promethearchaeota archaeon]|jgi:hypothetical protein
MSETEDNVYRAVQRSLDKLPISYYRPRWDEGSKRNKRKTKIYYFYIIQN